MFKLTWRNLVAHKMRLLMSALAIILGVGFLSGVLTFSNGLSRTFDGINTGATSDALVRLSGSSPTRQIDVGNATVIKPKDIERLRELPQVGQAEGQVDGFGMTLLDQDGKLVSIGGAPTLAFNYNTTPNMMGEQPMELADGRWPTGPREIVLDAPAAERAGYEVGDKVRVISPAAMAEIGAGGDLSQLQQRLTLVGTADFTGGGTAGAALVIFSTEGAQKMFLGGRNVFTSVLLTAADGVSRKALADAAHVVAPTGFEAVTGDVVVEETATTIGEMLSFVTIFLGVFAVIAVIVGGFIIANTFSILVAQRVRELALLRALGASKKQVRRTVLVEALLMAAVGSTIGLFLGLGLARGLAALLTNLGLVIDGSVLTLKTSTVLAAYAVGLLVTMVSAWLPARRAAKVPPVAAMRDDVAMSEGNLRRRTLIGLVLIVLGAALAVAGLSGAPGNDAIWIGVAAVIWVLTVAAISSVLGRPLLVACRAVFGRIFGTTGRLAGDNAIRNPRRTGATASALMIGLTLVSAVGVLAASMSATTDALVDEQFSSDFLVQSPTFMPIPTVVAKAMDKVDGVETVSRQQATMAIVDGKEDEPQVLIAADPAFSKIYELPMIDGTQELSGHSALLNETSAKKYDVGVGDTLELSFPGAKTVDVTVTGISEDSQVAGSVNVPLSLIKEVGIQRIDHSVSVNMAPGADKEAVKADLQKIVEDLPIVAVQDKQDFAESLKKQIDMLLYFIYGLLALSVVIAIVGIVNTLSLSVLERTREIGLLRAVGLSRARLRRMVTLESVTISFMGAVLGLGLGVLIGVLLQRALRDDLTALGIPWQNLGLFLVIAVLFGVLAAIVPAVRASRMKVLDAIATE
jgi:putative ABC transport system permease protein